jgi:ATP-binding cassette subfamily F protein 3
MILLHASHITKHFGPQAVLDGVTFEIRAGDKISLIGPNGTGKTTLLKILAGKEEMDSGTVETHAAAHVGYLEQQPEFAAGNTVWQESLAALAPWIRKVKEAERLAERIANTADDLERRRWGERYDRLHHELQQRDAYHLDHRIERVLEGLGFPRETFPQPVEQLSGGQQNRLLMAKLLLEEPDLMLLDEPSNHLDIDATQWLESFLAESKSALLVVSHDRFFLDKVTQRTFELFHGTVDAYPGNFTAYRRQKAERLEVQRRTYEKQQIEISKMEEFVRRHHYGQKHAQAEDRRKKLARLERVDQPREIAAPVMGFPAASRTGDVALRVEHLSKSYDQRLFEDLTFDILRGEKWGILGPNGCGKTTLLHCLLERTHAESGRFLFATGVRVGYFDQRLATLAERDPVLEAVRPDHREFPEQQRRDLLARYGIVGDMVHQHVASLSGGERNRVALARLAAAEANFLILDEPTNHLDLWSRSALEVSLRDFAGSVLLVSHDRYFLNQVVDHLLVYEDDRFRVIEGNYDTYLHWVRHRAGEAASVTKAASNGDEDQPKTTAKTARRKRQFPYRKVEDLEADIHRCEAAIEDLHAAMASPEVARDGNRMKQAKRELQDRQHALERLYAHWEEAVELN